VVPYGKLSVEQAGEPSAAIRERRTAACGAGEEECRSCRIDLP